MSSSRNARSAPAGSNSHTGTGSEDDVQKPRKSMNDRTLAAHLENKSIVDVQRKQANVLRDIRNTLNNRPSKRDLNRVARHQEQHAAASKLQDPELLKNILYSTYPSREVTQQTARKGNFEDLRQVVAFGWRRDDTEAVESLVGRGEDDIFLWPIETTNELEKSRMSGSMYDKRLAMVAYLAELTYDLCIDPRENVSRSFGFEVFGLRQKPQT